MGDTMTGGFSSSSESASDGERSENDSALGLRVLAAGNTRVRLAVRPRVFLLAMSTGMIVLGSALLLGVAMARVDSAETLYHLNFPQ